MADSDFTLPKMAAKDMVFQTALGDNKGATNGQIKDFKSFRHQIAEDIQNFSNSMTGDLKRMKHSYFERIENECYQSRYISDDFTNEP